jgi:hypothetical protein
MKKLTNYAPGPRGLYLLPESKGGAHELVWIEPGASLSVDPKRIVEPLPDLGAKPADDDAADEIATLTARNAELEGIVADQGKQIVKLTDDLEKATKPA